MELDPNAINALIVALTALATGLADRAVRRYRQTHVSTKPKFLPPPVAPASSSAPPNGLTRLQEAQGWEKAYQELRTDYLTVERNGEAARSDKDCLLAAVRELPYQQAQAILTRFKELQAGGGAHGAQP